MSTERKSVDYQAILERVKAVVVESLGVNESAVTETSSFTDDLGADSLDTVELVMAFEEEFKCHIPDDTSQQIRTVADAADFIVKCQTTET